MRSVSETDRHGDKMRRICQNNAFCRDKGQGWHIDFGKICAGERPMSEETAEIIIRISRILEQEDLISGEELLRILELLQKGQCADMQIGMPGHSKKG